MSKNKKHKNLKELELYRQISKKVIRKKSKKSKVLSAYIKQHIGLNTNNELDPYAWTNNETIELNNPSLKNKFNEINKLCKIYEESPEYWAKSIKRELFDNYA